MQAEVEISVAEVVTPVARDARRRKRGTRALPPHRVARELERSSEPAHISDGRAERLRDHLESGDVDESVLVTRILEPHERK